VQIDIAARLHIHIQTQAADHQCMLDAWGILKRFIGDFL